MKCVPCPLALILASSLLAQAPLVTPKRPVTDVIQGVQVTDALLIAAAHQVEHPGSALFQNLLQAPIG